MVDDPEGPESFMIAKAQRVCEAGIRRRAAPSNRAEMLKFAALVKARVLHGPDPILKAFGFSLAGIRHALQTEHDLGHNDADLLAAAIVHLVERA